METRSPSVAKIVTMVLFALSCVGLLLFLWLSFGGTMPFNPQGYRINIPFKYADELAPQEDVRIAGVSVGQVVDTRLAPDGNHTIATIQIDRQFAPLPANTRAILRTKTILGETYVQLTPGVRNGHYLKDGSSLPTGQVQPAVQLDQIFNTFDPKTRAAFETWQRQLATAIKGNSSNLSDVLGNLPAFSYNASAILTVLNVQHASVVNLIRQGGTVFGAIAQDPPALQNLIRTGETVFHTTAQQNQALAATFHVFPTFLTQTRLTMADLQQFSNNTNPLVLQLEPVARNLGPTMSAVNTLSPYLRHLFVTLGPLITASRTGLPATAQVVLGLKPLLGALGPWLEQFNPILDWLAIHQPLLSDFISNGASPLEATTTVFGGGGTGHYLRQFGPIGPETLGMYPNRDPNNRGNTYPPPIWLNTLQDFVHGDFPAWDCKNAGGQHGATATQQPCWVAPTLPGARPGQIPHLTAAHYHR
jgi:phospholipid/cholesterol/gamma-HCH transport system substrate-binding protein